MPAKENLKTLRETLGMNKNQFAVYLGVPNNYISDFESGKSNPGKKFETLLLKKMPNFNLAWFKYDQGEMFLKAPKKHITTATEVSVYGRIAAGLPVQTWNNEEYIVSISVPELEKIKKTIYGFIVSGDSMIERFTNGDTIFATLLSLPDELPRDKDFVVTTFNSEAGTSAANLKLFNWRDNNKEEFVLSSLNKRYAPSVHHISEVRNMFRVLGFFSKVDYKNI